MPPLENPTRTKKPAQPAAINGRLAVGDRVVFLLGHKKAGQVGTLEKIGTCKGRCYVRLNGVEIPTYLQCLTKFTD